MLRAGSGNPGNIAFLEGVVADQRRWHLPCKNDNGDRVGMSGGDTRDGIRCSRTGGHQGYPDLAGCPGVAVCGVHRPLFVANQNMFDIAAVKFIIDIDDGTAGIAENGVHIFFLKDL